MGSHETKVVQLFLGAGPKPAEHSFQAFVVQWLSDNGSSMTTADVDKNETLKAHIRRLYVQVESLRLMQIGSSAQEPARFEYVSSEPVILEVAPVETIVPSAEVILESVEVTLPKHSPPFEYDLDQAVRDFKDLPAGMIRHEQATRMLFVLILWLALKVKSVGVDSDAGRRAKQLKGSELRNSKKIKKWYNRKQHREVLFSCKVWCFPYSTI